jgi:hypothetical protein
VELNTPAGIYPQFYVDLLRRYSKNPLPSQQLINSRLGPALTIEEDMEEE